MVMVEETRKSFVFNRICIFVQQVEFWPELVEGEEEATMQWVGS